MPDTVRFVASFTPDSMWGKAIPAQVLAWRFTPDSTGVSSGDLTQYCLYPRTAYTCKLNIWRPGTMHVDMRINGLPETADLHVELREGELTLDANPTTVYPGDSVTFSTGAIPEDFAYSITKWWWIPDIPPIMAAIYIVPGASLSDNGNGSTTPDCPMTATECRVPVTASGTMYIEGTVSAKMDTASAHVMVHELSTPTLLCDTVARAATATCRIVAPVGATYSVGEWTFQGHVAVPPKLGGNDWTGMAVAPGQVAVEVNFQGQDTTLVAPFVVLNRPNWTWSAQITGLPGALSEIDACFSPGDAGLMSGLSCSASNPGVLFTPVNLSNGSGYTAQSVQDSGPNGGIWYVESATATMQLRTQIRISYRSDGPTHPMTGDSTIVSACATAFGTADSLNIRTVNTQCQQVAGFANFVTFVWNHEDRHMQAALTEGAQPQSDVHLLWEPLVATSESALAFVVDREYNIAHTAIAAAAQNTHTGTSHDFSFWRFLNGAWGWFTTRVFD